MSSAGGLIHGGNTTMIDSETMIKGSNTMLESAGMDRLIDGSNTILFLGMIDGGNMMLLLSGMGGLIDGRDTTLLLSAG